MSQQQTSPKPSKTFWQRTKTGSKYGFDKLWGYADKLGDPVNKLSHKLGSEAFWPTSLDKESEKAARILRSFCKDGFYQEDMYTPAGGGPTQKQRVLKRIPPDVIKNAKGLAIFTTMRTGLWFSGAGGSGILVGRKEDGNWSGPVGILLHTAGLGFLVGVDIYDCVLVINTQKALDAFSKWRCTVGGEISAVAGPAGIGGVLETEVHKRQAPVFNYLKSRGFYAGVQIDGTVIIERTDENERFYGSKVPAKDILAGKAQSRDWELRVLFATLKAAQGDRDVDNSLIPLDPPPADYEVVEEGHVFGVPDKEDPDPFGVHALEKEGLAIKEAGTHMPASSEDFEFKPSMTSPIYDAFSRRSGEGSSPRNSWRGSVTSTGTSSERRYATMDTSTQTDFEGPSVSSPTPLKDATAPKRSSVPPPLPPRTLPSSRARTASSPLTSETKYQSAEMGQQTTPQVHLLSHEEAEPLRVADDDKHGTSPEPLNEDDAEEDDHAEDEGSDENEEQVEVHEVQEFVQQSPRFITKARVGVVNVPKRIAPQLPARNPGRARTLNGSTASTPAEEKADPIQEPVKKPESSSLETVEPEPEKTEAVLASKSLKHEEPRGVTDTDTNEGTKSSDDEFFDDEDVIIENATVHDASVKRVASAEETATAESATKDISSHVDVATEDIHQNKHGVTEVNPKDKVTTENTGKTEDTATETTERIEDDSEVQQKLGDSHASSEKSTTEPGSTSSKEEAQESITSRASSPHKPSSLRSEKSVATPSEADRHKELETPGQNPHIPGGFDEGENEIAEAPALPEKAADRRIGRSSGPRVSMAALRRSLNADADEEGSRSPSPTKKLAVEDDDDDFS